MSRLLFPTAIGLCITVFASCSARRVAAPIDGEPVCPNFEVGAARTKFKGALKFPVKVTVLDGSSVVSERIVLGKRSKSDAPAKVVVEDSDETYTIRWAQCSNQFAPRRVNQKRGRITDNLTQYDCGDAKVFKEHKLEVRSGDVPSRHLKWIKPPNEACLESKVPAGTPSASASASAPPPPATSASSSASTSASAATPSSSASASSAASAAPTASTTATASKK